MMVIARVFTKIVLMISLKNDEKDDEDGPAPLEDEVHPPAKKPKRRFYRPARRNPFGMARLVCHLLPAFCLMTAMPVMAMESVDTHLESIDLDLLQQIAGPEPGKTVAPPPEVRM